MVTSRERFFLICGNNFLQKQKAIDDIKRKILQESSHSANLISFYPQDLEIKNFYKEIFTSAFSGTKVLILRNADKVDSTLKKFLSQNLKSILSRCCLVLETDKEFIEFKRDKKLAGDNFFKLVLKHAVCKKVPSGPAKVTLEDFKASLRRNDILSSIYILDNLFEGTSKDKALGPQILGILTWKFSYIKNTAAKDKIFSHLWEADRALKEKGADTRLVVEALLARLLRGRF